MELTGCHFPHLLSVSGFYHSTRDCQETEKWSALFFEADYQLHIQTHNHLLFPKKAEENNHVSLKQVRWETAGEICQCYIKHSIRRGALSKMKVIWEKVI